MANDPLSTLKINIITPEMIAPGAINQRHLYPGNSNKGDLYTGSDGVRFAEITIGSTGQVLMVIGGMPTWQTYPQTGVAASRPTSGRFTGDMYMATDTFAFSVWSGAAWKSTTLA